jgi:hypothetical protein
MYQSVLFFFQNELKLTYEHLPVVQKKKKKTFRSDIVRHNGRGREGGDGSGDRSMGGDPVGSRSPDPTFR